MSHPQYEDEERRSWQNPEEMLHKIGLEPGFTLVDVGCGAGFFTLPAARLVGEAGKVYGLDADREAISRLRDKAAREDLRNLSLRLGKAEETILCEACADIVFFSIALHDFRDPRQVLMNARIMLKPKGRLVDLDWKKESMEIGPPLEKRFSMKKARCLIEAAGFKTEAVEDAGPYQYLIVARPQKQERSLS